MLKLFERSITLQLLVFYCLFLLPLLLGGFELYLFQRDALRQNASRADLSLAQAIALGVTSTIQPAIKIDAALAQSQAARQLNQQQLSTTFALTSLSQPDIDFYAVCDPSGNIFLTYPIARKDELARSRFCASFDTAHQDSQPLLSITESSSLSQVPMLVITSRITENGRHTAGLMVVALSVEQFTARVLSEQRQLDMSGEVRMWVIDSEGHPLVNPTHIAFTVDQRATLPGVREASQGKRGNIAASRQGREWLYSYAPVALVGEHWAVIVQRPTENTFATVVSFRNSLGIALFMILIGASFFWFAMHGGVVAPLKKLARAVTAIRPNQAEKVMASTFLIGERDRIDEIGQLIAAFSAMEDEVHDLFRKSDEQSQARLHTLDAIMHSIDEGLLLEAPGGHIIYANQRFTRFVGLSPQENMSDAFDDRMIQEKLLALIEDPDAYLEAVRLAEKGTGSDVIALRVRGYYNALGQLVPIRRDIRLRLFQVRDQAGQLIGRGKVFQDVTRHNEAELIKKNLLAIVSHELRTPLTSIKGYATSLLEVDVEMDAAIQEEFLRGIVAESDRMAELVTSLLDMSQIEAGTLKLSLAPYRVESLIERVITEKERHHIVLKLSTNLPLIYVDGRRIEIVLRNLLQNARRYAGENARIEIVARYEREEAKSGLFLSVIDNGAGIPPHLTERIFDRFYQVDSGRRRSSSGVGLGLAICRGFVEAHGGRIWAENRSDGAAFHIWLPPHVLHAPDAQPDTFALPNKL